MKNLNKKVAVVRLGAFGDGVMITPGFRYLAKDGYAVTVHASDQVETILRWNPFIAKFVVYKRGAADYNDAIQNARAECDKVIDLTGSIEGGLLAIEGTEEFNLPHHERHARYNYNYYDRIMELFGYPKIKGSRGEIFFSYYERQCGLQLRAKYKNKFLIVWALSGSAHHKAYPWTEHVIMEFLSRHDDARVITVGDVFCKFLEWTHPHVRHESDNWSIRRTLIATAHCDLVVGPETGVINAAGCFDTPKIVLLSHSSKENLTKHFKNCISLHAGTCACTPCHRLIYSRSVCPTDRISGAAKCMAEIPPEAVVSAMEDVYYHYKEVVDEKRKRKSGGNFRKSAVYMPGLS